jgi:hypothetical protein
LGHTKRASDAAIARDIKARELFGEEAKMNYPAPLIPYVPVPRHKLRAPNKRRSDVSLDFESDSDNKRIRA